MIFFSFIISLILLSDLLFPGDALDLATYGCSLCLATADHYLASVSQEGTDKSSSMGISCRLYFPDSLCNEMGFKLENSSSIPSNPSSNSRDYCIMLGKCEPISKWIPSNAAGNSVDIRVAKALGSRGYDKVRVSVVSSNGTVSSPFFDYSSQFRYRWTDKYLSSGIVTVTPGKNNHFTIAGIDVDIFIPFNGEGVRGVIVADPCFQSQWIVCPYQSKFDTFQRTTDLLNAAFSHTDMHYWQILGDNFYDQDGEATSSFFQALSSSTKSHIFATVPGNHDLWVNSAPKLWVPKDQLGNGFMQFYGQDVLASISSSTPYDFSNDPDGPNKSAENLPPATNFFFYNKVGNVAFFGYSGAHSLTSMESSFQQACEWAETENPDVVLLLGHWNSDGDGCDADTTVPSIFKYIQALPACKTISTKLRYFMGHKHCNQVTEPEVGYMVGGMGMSDVSCGGTFGFPVVDTTNNRFRVLYFPIAHTNEFDNYDNILSCFQTQGVSSCYHLAEEWANLPF